MAPTDDDKTPSTSPSVPNIDGNGSPPENGSRVNDREEESSSPEAAVNPNLPENQDEAQSGEAPSNAQSQCDIIASTATATLPLKELQPGVITTSDAHTECELVASSRLSSASTDPAANKRDAESQCGLLEATNENLNYTQLRMMNPDRVINRSPEKTATNGVTTRDQGVLCNLILPSFNAELVIRLTDEQLKMKTSEFILSWFPRMGRLDARDGTPVKVVWHALELGWTNVKTPVLLIEWEGVEIPHWVKAEFMSEFHEEFMRAEEEFRKRLKQLKQEALSAKVTSRPPNLGKY